ncbi:MAG: hypothetical protein ACI96L_000202 [Paracoccaceae bacterium]
MKEIEPSEISLLFKSLVVLPEDKAAKPSPKNSETKLNLVLNAPKATELGTPTATQPKATEKTEAPEATNIAEEPKAAFAKKRITILTTPKLKEAYLEAGSNFLKTLDALKVPQLSAHLNTDNTLLEKADQYICIWCIGLDIKFEKEAKHTAHENLLYSPDLNSLKTTEEKKAMFIPLKNFITLNFELISSL